MSRVSVSRIGGPTLFALVFAAVFIVPVVPGAWHKWLYNALYTAIFFAAVLSLERQRGAILGFAVGVSVLEWIAEALQLLLLTTVSRLFSVTFFMVIVFALIVQIVRHREVDARVILAAVNGYLLLGLAASMVIAAVCLHSPEAFGYSASAPPPGFSDHVYYGFVTLTTVGYGDIVPREPYAKSLATLIGVTGQMYVAIIIAMLVGKFAVTRR